MTTSMFDRDGPSRRWRQSLRPTLLAPTLSGPLLAIALLGGPAAAAPFATVSGKPVDDAPLVEAVNDLNDRLGEGRTLSAEQRGRLKTRQAARLLAGLLVEQRIAQEKLKVSDRELDAAVQAKREQFNHDKGFRAFLAATGQTEATLREALRGDLLREKLITRLLKQPPPTVDDARVAYRKDPDAWQLPESAKIRQILITKPAGADEATLAARRKVAQDLYKKVARSPRSFPDLAMRKSEGPAKRLGGAIGRVRRGRWGERFDAVVFRADERTVVGPIETPTAFHIVYIEEHYGPEELRFAKPLVVVRDALHERWELATWGPLMRRLFVDAKVKILDPEVKLGVAELAALKTSKHLVHEGPSNKTSAEGQANQRHQGHQGHKH